MRGPVLSLYLFRIPKIHHYIGTIVNSAIEALLAFVTWILIGEVFFLLFRHDQVSQLFSGTADKGRRMLEREHGQQRARQLVLLGEFVRLTLWPLTILPLIFYWWQRLRHRACAPKCHACPPKAET